MYYTQPSSRVEVRGSVALGGLCPCGEAGIRPCGPKPKEPLLLLTAVIPFLGCLNAKGHITSAELVTLLELVELF